MGGIEGGGSLMGGRREKGRKATKEVVRRE